MHSKSGVFATTTIFAFGFTAAVFAFAPAAVAEVTDAASENSMEEVIVTAQKRSERLQDVPISVSAFNSGQLVSQGISTTQDLRQVTPGLTITQSAGYIQPFIRGIGSSTVDPGETGSVAFYIDGVYVPFTQGNIYDTADVQSIEVLKGPQGTLFGRNTSGGAITLTTRAPQFSPAGNAELSYGNFNSRAVRGYVTGPITEKIAGSLTGSYKARDGYFNDLFRGGKVGDSENYSLRGSLLFTPTDNLSIRLSADSSHYNDPTGILVQPHNGYLGLTATTLYPKGPYDYVGDAKAKSTGTSEGGYLRVEYEFPAFSAISITADRFFRDYNLYDSDATPIPYSTLNDTEKGSNFSQEFQLLSRGEGPFRWILGAYYSNEDAQYAPVLVNTLAIRTDEKSDVRAVFADGTYKIGDFELTAGLRYDHENKSYTGSINGVVLVNNVPARWNSLTPRFIAAYHPNSDLLVYASYSKGFKSGAFNVTSFTKTPLKPEKTNAYEVGLKYEASRKVTFNAAAFWYNTKNLQVRTQDPVTNLAILANAASERSRGADFDLTLHPLGSLAVTAGLAYLDAAYTSFPNAQAYLPYPPAAPPALPNSLGNKSVTVNATGKRAVRSPEWTFDLGVSYAIDVADGGSVVPSVNMFTTSSYYWDANNRLKQGPFTLVNAEIKWNLPGDQVELSIWGKNLGNTLYLAYSSSTNQTDRQISAEPRTYGVRLGYTF